MLAHIHRSLLFILDENNGPFPGFTSEPVDQVIVSENQTILCQGKGKNIFRQKMHITYNVTKLVGPMRRFEVYSHFCRKDILTENEFLFFITTLCKGFHRYRPLKYIIGIPYFYLG